MSECVKQGHKTKQAADRHAYGLKKEYGHKVNSYRCPYCGLWHVGRGHGVILRLKALDKTINEINS